MPDILSNGIIPEPPDLPLPFKINLDGTEKKSFPNIYINKLLNKILKNEAVTLKLTIKPAIILIIVTLLVTTYFVGFTVARYLFPPTPLLHKEVIYQGNLQKTDAGEYLVLPDNSIYKLKPTSLDVNLANFANRQVLIKGNFTGEQNLINVTDIKPVGN